MAGQRRPAAMQIKSPICASVGAENALSSITTSALGFHPGAPIACPIEIEGVVRRPERDPRRDRYLA